MKRIVNMRLLAVILMLVLSACQPKANDTAATSDKPAVDLKNEKIKASYMVGLDLAKQIAPLRGEVDIDIVVKALRAAHTGEKPMLDDVQADEIRKKFTEHLREIRESEHQALAAKNLKEGDAFLAENAKKDGIETTASGLQYQVIRAGKGGKPSPNDTVRVNYIGTLLDGRKFEDTYAIDHAAEFALNQIMPGWREGVTLMPVGSKYKFWIPAKLAYSERGIPGTIEPNATLVFEVELLEIAGQAAGNSPTTATKP